MKIPEEGSWSFRSIDIADNFDKHVREQLPWYDMATDLVVHIARHYLPVGGRLYDIGAATGNITRRLSGLIANRGISAISIEQSAEMAERFNGEGEIYIGSAEDYIYQRYDVSIMFLTMMFVPVSKRKALLDTLMSNCRPGGVLIIFDKMPPTGGYMSTVIYRLALAGKLSNNVSAEAILKKELSLSGVQIPYKPPENMFKKVFQFGDFAGWIYEKSDRYGEKDYGDDRRN